MRRFFGRLVGDRSGTTAIEYALIASLVVMAIVTAVTLMGQQILGLFNQVAAAFP
ncbi:Flp family type IVb pilin [Phenylobacterium sp.]|jgi:pilus assembly protein Flp/PilA|uniref:Flp family type IVb pilin n=1 Tax=Phenylobacterium sp. TaxID=1871053 RepID=UPI002F40A604